ncbi:MAG TPA: alpha/beta fold hydrolase [Symbiobacteriaceae bacterium]|nr:alpha/beta fold hydrolase [Symbiobacteriaceae bacterium]
MAQFHMRRPAPIQIAGGPEAVLILHGLAGSPAEIRPLAEFLGRAGFTISAPLLPGHGTHPEELRKVRYQDWVQAGEAELKRLQAHHPVVHVIGFSMGSIVALHLAAHHEGITTVTTLASPVKMSDWRQSLVPVLRFFVRDYPARVSNPEIARQVQNYDFYPVSAIHQFLRMKSRVRRLLPRIRQPILIVQGEQDRVIALDSAATLYHEVSSVVKQQIMLPKRRHFLALEPGREELFQQIQTFLTAKRDR